jgi:hypothetical protein
MKKIALLLLLAASFSMPAFAADGAEPIKLISYNLRNSHGKDGDNVWMKRRHATPEMIRREAPDVFGVQEGLIDQLHYIDTECPQYARVGVGRDDGAEKGEFMAVYYLRDRFELLDSGTFWLSETPDKVSRGWDGACNRTVTWVELKDRKSGKEFFYFNTHLDHKGKGATMLILGAILMIVCHLTFAFVLPEFPSKPVAYGSIVLLGISFSLVPAALWPSVPKIVETRYLGSAYSLIFWIQNIGLCLFPMLFGFALKYFNAGRTEGMPYDYTRPMLIFVACGVLAMLLGLWLKAEDRKKKYGLELPNIKK